MRSILNLEQYPDLEYTNLIIICPKVTSFSEFYIPTLNQINANTGILKLNPLTITFIDFRTEIDIAKKLFEDEKFFDALKSIDNYLFRNFALIAQAFDQTLQDGTELPNIVTRLKEEKLISEGICFQTLDAFLMLDGLMYQVNAGESLSERDFVLLTAILGVFSEMNFMIVIPSVNPFEQKVWLSSNNIDRLHVISVSSFYSICWGNTFPTSSNTVTQSSMTVFM